MARSRGGMVMLLLFVAMLAATHQSASAAAEAAPKGVTLSFPPFNSKYTCSIDPAIGIDPKYICTPTTDPTSLALSYDDDVVSARYQYNSPVQLWKKNSKYVASFSTSFVVNFDRSSEYTIKHLFGGGGLAFAITPSLSVIGSNSESFGLFEIDQKTGNPVAGVSSAKTVAVEIDVSRNGESWDPAIPHIGLDVNSVKSVKTKYLGDPNNFDDHKVSRLIHQKFQLLAFQNPHIGHSSNIFVVAEMPVTCSSSRKTVLHKNFYQLGQTQF